MTKMNRGKISEKLYKQLDKKGLLKEIKIFRDGLNAYNEQLEDLYVCIIKGYYYRKDTRIVANSKEDATINNQYNERLLCIYDKESQKLKKDDYFIYRDIKYKIVDIGNIEDIVFDITLNRA